MFPSSLLDLVVGRVAVEALAVLKEAAMDVPTEARMNATSALWDLKGCPFPVISNDFPHLQCSAMYKDTVYTC